VRQKDDGKKKRHASLSLYLLSFLFHEKDRIVGGGEKKEGKEEKGKRLSGPSLLPQCSKGGEGSRKLWESKEVRG